MSYTPTEWKSGDTVTSAKLNKMEAGIAEGCSGGVLVVNSSNDGTLDKTWVEIYEAPVAFILSYRPEANGLRDIGLVERLWVASSSDTPFKLSVILGGFEVEFKTSSENGYPSVDGGAPPK